MRKFGAAIALSVLLVTTGCGGSSTRPSEDELSKALVKGGDGGVLGSNASRVGKKGADCIAKVLVKSRISDRALQAIVDANKNYRPTSADTAAAFSVREKIVACLPSSLPN